MLGNKDAVANIAVKDLQKGRNFYEQTLGLQVVDTEGEEVVTFKSGSTSLYVYRSQYAGTNRATAVTWSVGNEIESIVRTLAAKGVRFEHYDMPGTTLTGDIHVMGARKVAWLKDPDGNILCLVNA
jgi:catechol 2,3-dioxygenase-like lactoylglutathione lyase family enzyme